MIEEIAELNMLAGRTTITLDEGDKRTRNDSPVHFHTMNTDELLKILKETKSLHDEADILHYLFETK